MEIKEYTYAVRAEFNDGNTVYYGHFKTMTEAENFANELLTDDSDLEDYAETAEAVCVNIVHKIKGEKK